MKPDSQAPLWGKQELVIDAPVAHVWKIQSEISDWPSWQKEVTQAQLQGKLQTGTIFRWKAMGMDITSILQAVQKDKVIGWSGKSIGMSAIHFWTFEGMGKKTRVVTEESLSGWLPRLIAFVRPDFLDQSLMKALQALKVQAEKTVVRK